MTTVHPPGMEPLFEALRSAYEVADPMPEGLTDRVLVAIALDDIDLEYELLTLVHRSEKLAGVRGGDEQKTVLEFTASGLTVLLRISPADGAHRRIDGWVSPAQSVSAVFWQEGAAQEAQVSSQGRFEFDAVPLGLSRLELLRTDDPDATAFRTTLFEV